MVELAVVKSREFEECIGDDLAQEGLMCRDNGQEHGE